MNHEERAQGVALAYLGNDDPGHIATLRLAGLVEQALRDAEAENARLRDIVGPGVYYSEADTRARCERAAIHALQAYVEDTFPRRLVDEAVAHAMQGVGERDHDRKTQEPRTGQGS